MGFERPANPTALTKDEKVALLKDYVTYYKREAAGDPTVLNQKIPRQAFASLISQIGESLLTETKRLANQSGTVSDFLEATPLPPSMAKILPREFRTYCLALNALKQWVSAEQAATDRFCWEAQPGRFAG